MIVEKLSNETKLKPNSTVLTLGSFDGIHLGHQFLLRRVVGEASERDKESLLIVFDPHPREVLKGTKVKRIATFDEASEVVAKLGFKRHVTLPFTRELASLSAKEFVEGILIDQLGMAGLVLGYDHSFGKNRDATDDLLLELSEKHAFTFQRVEALSENENIYSSTLIRSSLSSGDIETANSALGRPYELRGKVVTGQKRGRTIGFPTANLQINDSSKMIPLEGVYAVKGYTEAGFLADGMLNIGIRPTFDDGEDISIETFFFDIEKDLYDKTLILHVFKRIRDELKFDSIEELKNRLVEDEQDCKSYFKSLS